MDRSLDEIISERPGPVWSFFAMAIPTTLTDNTTATPRTASLGAEKGTTAAESTAQGRVPARRSPKGQYGSTLQHSGHRLTS